MIQIKKLTKKYGNNIIFENASFDFPSTGLICLLGASGCGKSTLLNMLAGFDSNYVGDISVKGTFISEMGSDDLCAYRRDNVGFIFQNYCLLKGYTVLENVLLPCELSTENKEISIKKATEFLAAMGMAGKINEKIENLSGGEKQRVSIARALINGSNIILADEPTGALDRKNSTEIMELLKDLSKERLVIVITHDPKVCSFAHGIIRIETGKILTEKVVEQGTNNSNTTLTVNKPGKISAFKRGLKNFKVNLTRYITVSFSIAIGILSFMLSLSSSNIIDKSIDAFKEKNTAFNNGYIKGYEKTVFEMLASDERIENVYRQYKVENIKLSFDDKSEFMKEKYPMPKATESMSYGVMPRKNQNEIALSPSLAKKFANDINNLIGKEISLEYNGEVYNLAISGIFNAAYDDFFVSSDIEQYFYTSTKDENCYSISYDVKEFNNIVSVSKMLKDNRINSNNASREVENLQVTFLKISRLFMTVSVLVLAIGLLISVILLFKLQSTRYKELGLLSAIGFDKQSIRNMIIDENLLLSVMTVMFNLILIGCVYFANRVFDFSIIISLIQVLLSLSITGFAIITISVGASYKLIHTEPAVALRK